MIFGQAPKVGRTPPSAPDPLVRPIAAAPPSGVYLLVNSRRRCLTVRVALALAATIWIPPACAQTASIEGQVINLKTGDPLRDATVTLNGPYAKTVLTPEDRPLPAPIRIVSGDQGRFTFRNLAAGNYTLGAGHSGFESGGYFAYHVAVELLPVGEGQQVKDIAIKLAPLGVIAGKVVDDAGKPLQNARITVYRYSSGQWMRAIQTGEPTQFGYTNDLGEYRAALRPGPYIVSAAYPFAIGQLEPDLTPGMGHPTMYYPNAPGPDTAQSLMVVSGETLKADFTLKKAPAYRISGYVTSPQGRVLGAPCVGIVPKGTVYSELLMMGSISTGPLDGSFTVVDVPPGSYTLTGCGRDPLVYGIQDVDVTGNVDGLKLMVAPEQSLRGTLKVEDDASAAGAMVELLGTTRGSSAPVTSGSGLQFDHVLPAMRYIPEIQHLPPNSYVKSIRYGGQEVPVDGFLPAASESLEITISAAGAAQLTGSVTDAAGRPVRYPLVTVMPSDGGPAASAKSVMGDADGKFAFQALRPGAYIAAAWEEIVNPVPLARDPRVLKLYRDKGKAVTVQPGAPAAVGLTLIGAAEVTQARSKP